MLDHVDKAMSQRGGKQIVQECHGQEEDKSEVSLMSHDIESSGRLGCKIATKMVATGATNIGED